MQYKTLEILSQVALLPRVLNLIVVDYTLIMYEEKTIEGTIKTNDFINTIINDNTYTYDTITKTLTRYDNIIYNVLRGWKRFAFDGHFIYILDGTYIHVFNELCKKIREIQLQMENNMSFDFAVINNMVFFGYNFNKKYITIYKSNGKCKSRLRYKYIQWAQIVQTDIFVLIESNTIVKLSENGLEIERYKFKTERYIHSFHIIGDDIHIIYECTHGIYIYDLCRHLVKKDAFFLNIWEGLFYDDIDKYAQCLVVWIPYGMRVDNDTLYVYTCLHNKNESAHNFVKMFTRKHMINCS